MTIRLISSIKIIRQTSFGRIGKTPRSSKTHSKKAWRERRAREDVKDSSQRRQTLSIAHPEGDCRTRQLMRRIDFGTWKESPKSPSSESRSRPLNSKTALSSQSDRHPLMVEAIHLGTKRILKILISNKRIATWTQGTSLQFRCRTQARREPVWKSQLESFRR